MNLYVGNLSYSMTDDALLKLFGQYGKVVSAKIIMDRDTNRSKGFGFVEMESTEAGNEAIKNLNGQQTDGRALRVNEAKPKEAGGGGGGGPRGKRY